jgi:ubiquinone biosynthesis accessory factor UbiK
LQGKKMIDTTKLNELATNLFEALPDGVKSVQKDVKSIIKQALQSGFSKMDLVSREEFDVQAKILARTQEKLEKLEVHVADLEKQKAE